MAAIRFLTTLAKSVHSALFQDDAVLKQARLCTGLQRTAKGQAPALAVSDARRSAGCHGSHGMAPGYHAALAAGMQVVALLHAGASMWCV